MTRTMTKHLLHRIALSTALSGLAATAQAHEGHGLPGASHWHSTDVIGYVIAVGIIGALWFTRRK